MGCLRPKGARAESGGGALRQNTGSPPGALWVSSSPVWSLTEGTGRGYPATVARWPRPPGSPTRARVKRIRDRLRAVYGIPLMEPHGDPIAELVLTVLSQSTNDRNRDVAYLRSARKRFRRGRR